MIDARYKNWLRNAHEYYFGSGFVTMSDHEWDRLAKEFASRKDEFDELRGEDYTGGSLFWLKRNQYPDWARVPP